MSENDSGRVKIPATWGAQVLFAAANAPGRRRTAKLADSQQSC
jgi:hypothetical protein